jgi:hypothetical protein
VEFEAFKFVLKRNNLVFDFFKEQISSLLIEDP